MRVFVCGAEYRNSPGFAIAKRLLAEGHSVAALSRFRGGGQSLTNIGIELVVGDVEDADVQGQIVKADAVIDAELPRPDTREKKELARLRPSLLRRTLEGADRPLIATSSVDVLGDTGPAPLGEGAPFHAPPKYLGWLPSLDREILQSVGVRGMVIRPALVYGLSPMPGQRDDIPYPPRGMETWIALAIQFNQGKYIGSGANCWSAVHRDDLADLYCLALEKAGAGTLLNASSETFSIKELAEVIHRAFGFKGEPSSLSLDEARRVTPGTEADFLNCNRAISGDLAVRTVGWQPTRPSIMKEVEELVQLYKARHILLAYSQANLEPWPSQRCSRPNSRPSAGIAQEQSACTRTKAEAGPFNR